MLQNAKVTAFMSSELLRETQHRGVKITPPPPSLPQPFTQIRIKMQVIFASRHEVFYFTQQEI